MSIKDEAETVNGVQIPDFKSWSHWHCRECKSGNEWLEYYIAPCHSDTFKGRDTVHIYCGYCGEFDAYYLPTDKS